MLRALARSEPGQQLGPRHLPECMVRSAATRALHDAPGETLRARVACFERVVIRDDALERNDRQRTATARELGMTREGLHKKSKRLNTE